MPRSIPKIYLRFVIVAAFAVPAPRLASAAELQSETRYPDYNVQQFCHAEANARPTERRHQCEDQEYAVSILLRQQWTELARSEPALLDACAGLIGRYEAHPSYVSLLQCLTKVRDAAD